MVVTGVSPLLHTLRRASVLRLCGRLGLLSLLSLLEILSSTGEAVHVMPVVCCDVTMFSPSQR